MTSKADKEHYLSLAPTIPGGVELYESVFKKQATKEVQQHALFTYYFTKHTQRSIASLYGKSLGTVNTWTKRWETNLEAGRKAADSTFKKFGKEHRYWITQYYDKYPLTFIDEGCSAFEHHWKRSISPTQLWRILNDAGYTWKVCPSLTIVPSDACLIKMLLIGSGTPCQVYSQLRHCSFRCRSSACPLDSKLPVLFG